MGAGTRSGSCWELRVTSSHTMTSAPPRHGTSLHVQLARAHDTCLPAPPLGLTEGVTVLVTTTALCRLRRQHSCDLRAHAGRPPRDRTGVLPGAARLHQSSVCIAAHEYSFGSHAFSAAICVELQSLHLEFSRGDPSRSTLPAAWRLLQAA